MADFYEAMQQGFGWQVPEQFNMAEACSRRWALQQDASMRVAIVEHAAPNARGRAVAPRTYSYAQLQQAADALSHVLTGLGVQRGDRVAIVLPQRFETAVAYMAVMQMGAVAMPLSLLFGPEALAYRLQDSEAVVAIADAASVSNVLAVRAQCAALRASRPQVAAGVFITFFLAIGCAMPRLCGALLAACARLLARRAVAVPSCSAVPQCAPRPAAGMASPSRTRIKAQISWRRARRCVGAHGPERLPGVLGGSAGGCLPD
jgi:hypothetical protein